MRQTDVRLDSRIRLRVLAFAILLVIGFNRTAVSFATELTTQSTNTASTSKKTPKKPKPSKDPAAEPAEPGSGIDGDGADQGDGTSGIVRSPGSVLFDTCFSPHQGCDQKLIHYINNARSTLDVAIYSITHSGIADAIVAAKNRGLTVRMVVDRSQSKGKSSLTGSLTQQGIDLRIGNFSGIMHDKFTIVDGTYLETGSYNYSQNATSNNGENQLYLNEPNVVQRYQSNFESMWENALSK